ncbi:hypothetical protein BDZ94DRAFT_1200301 [Collybia nuda]|uniref:Phosphatidic acid phosphatase type 2/haloperoxidase domain-containing protein n=1 Tax=Collybia nuda TaxID=64659 RepID=A0A9P5XWB4_9AGAR|nr:hypothetical protein BDZ94DRAFT_1200301 [Collybia nuda]
MSAATQNGRGRNSTVHFTTSAPGSADSSRSSSPVQSFYENGHARHGGKGFYESAPEKKSRLQEALEEEPTPGLRAMDVYDATLPRWRAATRRMLVRTVKRESEIIAKMQDAIRTPWLDAYFVYTSSLGTHTFFMTVLPAFFFFGHAEMGRGLLIVLALGVYCSSFVKDLICSPRPFAPPVTRLTIGSHHLEYGFPSTHSTNSVSIALFFFGHVHRLASTPNPIISAQIYTLITIILSIYTVSIVFGRLYTAMHSFTDCVVGVAMGAGIWWGHTSWSGVPFALTSSNPLYWLYSAVWPSSVSGTGTHIIHLGKGLGAGKWVEDWVHRGGWEVPIILIPLCLLAVNQHPQPVDDCPCFEDAIAFGSVVLGALVAEWAMDYAGIGLGVGRTVVMPGSGWAFELGKWVQYERSLGDIGLWWGVATLKMVVGILVIFTWRLLAKSALHLILPPTFRVLSRVFRLPNRRFYTPATDYKTVPSEFSATGRGGSFGLHPIPSVIDLPGTGGVGVEVGGIGSGSGVGGVSDFGVNEIKLRGGSGGSSDSGDKGKSGNGQTTPNGVIRTYEEKERTLEGKTGEPVKHYDADVLTKVVVYAGIAVLACNVLPVMFEILGWGVYSSV